MVAGRTPARVQHGSFLDETAAARRRTPDAGDHGRGLGAGPERRRIRWRKNIDPQWSKDGRSLYFLSDRQGITNVYRIPVDGGELMQLTNILTGVSGITSLSPALSAGNGRIVFSAYENDGYNIYALDGDRMMAETRPVQLPIDAGVLPPRRTGEGPVFAAIHDETTGLPVSAPPETQPYKPKFSLDYAGQPTIGIGQPIRLAPTRQAACRSCSATRSATISSPPPRKSPTGSTSSAEACST